MADNTPDEPIKPIDDANPIEPALAEPTAFEPEPAPAAPAAYEPAPAAPPAYAPLPPQPDVLADVHHPVGSSYDPMPLQVDDSTSRNWLGIVSLIFGIIGGSLIAIVLGIIGLNAVKQGKATNKGMNIWGIVLGAFWAVVSVAAVVAFVIFAADVAENIDDAVEAQPGECYVSTISSSGELESVNPTFGACAGTENAVVYFVTDYTGLLTPQDADFPAELEAVCTSDEAVAAVDVDKATAYYVEYYVPFADAWEDNPHTVICGLSTDGEPVDTTVVLP